MENTPVIAQYDSQSQVGKKHYPTTYDYSNVVVIHYYYYYYYYYKFINRGSVLCELYGCILAVCMLVNRTLSLTKQEGRAC